MDSIRNSDRMVVNINTAPFRPYVVDGQEMPGEGFLQLDDTFPPGAGFYVYRMAPGVTTIPHEHTCHEQFLVLEGELIDHDGYVYKPGDFVLLKEGTIHNSRTETGTTLAIFVREAERNL
ncbi:hypothetical protein BH10PSE7_BH10PSE7_09970 [soil metagenome]